MGPTAYIYEDFLITLSESCQNWISIPCFPFKLQLSITFCLKMSSAARDSVKKDFKISIKQLKWLNDFRFCPFKSVISDINHTRRQGQEIFTLELYLTAFWDHFTVTEQSKRMKIYLQFYIVEKKT